MKKTKLISIILVAVMLMGMIPAGILSVSAADTGIPDMPTSYPDGAVTNLQNIGQKPIFADFGVNITGVNNANHSIVYDEVTKVGKWKTKSVEAYYSGVDSNGSIVKPYNGSTLGAAGFMFYLEVKDATTQEEYTAKKAQFNLAFSADYVQRGSTAHFATAAQEYVQGAVKTGTDVVYYTYDEANGWSGHKDTGYYMGTTGSKWYFVPFSSFCYDWTNDYKTNSGSDISQSISKQDEGTWGMSFTEFSEKYQKGIGNLYNFRIRHAQKNTAYNLYFNDIYMIYPEFEAASENASTVEMMPNMAINGNPEGGAVASITDGVLTVKGTTSNNTTNASGQRVWLKPGNNSTMNLSGAAGIRFHVDTSALGNEQLILRLRLLDSVEPDTIPGDYTLLTTSLKGTTDYVTLENAASGNNYTTIQHLLRSPASSVFVYDKNGDLVPCYGGENKFNGARNTHSDYVLLPAGYVGDVYIPMDSYWSSMGGSWGNYPLVGFEKAASLGLYEKVKFVGVVQGYTGTPGADVEIKYSDFEIVYDEIEVTKTLVSMGNDLAMSVFAATENGATVTGATYTIGNDTTAYTANVTEATGGYAIKCDGILPQNAGEKITVTVNGNVGNAAVTATVTSSVKEYCMKLLASDESEAAKNAAADLLRYANEAQLFAAGENSIEAPILDTAAIAAIKDLGAKTDFTALTLTNNSSVTESTAAGYKMTGAALRLNNALAIKLFVAVPAESAEKVTATFTLGNNTETVTVDDGYCIFGGVGAADFAEEVTVVLSVGENAVQTLTYHVNDYIASALANENIETAELLLVQALYNYGVSASAYNASVSK